MGVGSTVGPSWSLPRWLLVRNLGRVRRLSKNKNEMGYEWIFKSKNISLGTSGIPEDCFFVFVCCLFLLCFVLTQSLIYGNKPMVVKFIPWNWIGIVTTMTKHCQKQILFFFPLKAIHRVATGLGDRERSCWHIIRIYS